MTFMWRMADLAGSPLAVSHKALPCATDRAPKGAPELTASNAAACLPAAVKNAFGKQLGTANPLNNARATLEGIKQMRTFQQVSNISEHWIWEQWLELGRKG